MKSKLMLLLIAAVGSTALVASAQTPSTYVISGNNPGELQATPQPPQPPLAPVIQGFTPRPDANNAMRYRLFGNRPQVFTWTAEEGGLSQQAEQLAQKLAEAKSDGDREKIKSQLTEMLEKQFDQRQKRHEEEIKALEAQIKKLRDMVEKRQENRREIIARRLDQVVKESQGLGW
jgi:hypothetical protein